VVNGTLEHLGLYRLELQVVAGTGKLSVSGSGSDTKTKEAIKIAFDYFKANISRVSSMSRAGDHDYHLHIVEIHNTGPARPMTLCSLIAFCSGLMGNPVMGQLVVVGDMSLGGNIVPATNVAEALQVAFDSGVKRILLPMSNVNDIPSVPGELFAKFQTSFYSDPVDAVFKALGVE
jgi:ATP-dependent Lon protease